MFAWAGGHINRHLHTEWLRRINCKCTSQSSSFDTPSKAGKKGEGGNRRRQTDREGKHRELDGCTGLKVLPKVNRTSWSSGQPAAGPACGRGAAAAQIGLVAPSGDLSMLPLKGQHRRPCLRKRWDLWLSPSGFSSTDTRAHSVRMNSEATLVESFQVWEPHQMQH